LQQSTAERAISTQSQPAKAAIIALFRVINRCRRQPAAEASAFLNISTR
jgi:hypothetical protein